VVSDQNWLRTVSQAVGAMLPCPTRTFRNSEWNDAIAWLAAPTAARNVEHRLLQDQGVLVIEPRGRLGVEDFDAIAMTVDPWLEAGHELRGVVVHAREFPGWENFGSFLRHMRFIGDHHRKVRRVALAADGALAKIAPTLLDVFVAAEVRHFGFGDMEQALCWAGG
jgi:hypothetical protein